MRVLGLKLDSLVVDSSRSSMRLRLAAMRNRHVWVGGGLRLVLGLAFPGALPYFSLPRPLLARQSLAMLIVISHTCNVPHLTERNPRLHQLRAR